MAPVIVSSLLLHCQVSPETLPSGSARVAVMTVAFRSRSCCRVYGTCFFDVHDADRDGRGCGVAVLVRGRDGQGVGLLGLVVKGCALGYRDLP